MVVLTEDDPPFRSLKIIIGQPEARAIQAAWHGAVPSRPSTWDLFISTVAILGGRLDRVVITAVQEERHYYAVLEVEQAGERRIMACRPSDALALAVRGYNADIFAEARVLEDAGLMPDGTKASDASAAAPATATATSLDGDDADAQSVLAEREAVLAAREAELAARERAVAEREREMPTGWPPPAQAPTERQREMQTGGQPPAPAAGRADIAADALEVAANAVAVAAEALQPPCGAPVPSATDVPAHPAGPPTMSPEP